MQVRLDALRDALAPYPWAYALIMLSALLLVAWLANFVTRRILLRGLRHVLARVATLTGYAGDSISRMRVISRLANVVPALVIGAGIGLVPDLPPQFVAFVTGLCRVFVIFTVALAFGHALDVANEVYERRPDARNKPIKGYLQVAKIIALVMAALGSVALLAGVDLVHVLTGLGAASAVLMLIFQDTILSFAASLQISGDGRVRIGDWIEMPSQNADGDVMDIALHTVTVQNWDKTITTVPTRKLISDSFKNWRGMTESGGRRIKRAIYLDQHSTRFLEADEVARFRRFRLLDAYLDGKSSELQDWNAKLAERGGEPVNRRRVTNLGTFRAYVEQYLRNHPGVHQDMSLMVRQLQPTDAGLPLEIYCFTNDVRWAVYEGIQADIFDHLLAILPEFGLRVFQAHSDAPVEVRLTRDADAGPATG
ncbi:MULTISPECIES: mechanosensitive ion channel domain-containing protein [unclassified Luteimonas]|uniref:mechanosensitive ion channel family protein n=1 Tax=unclassified Luteimonas TaxID=2629088 RepID=UPI0018F0720C|nr:MULTISPECIES: mechanosensitive ion channel domain-containing protein [unclassified Luteimonas]MBJ6979902.1 mechanosensitive ion channel [Luteimonas sp. MC1895]MBJ6985613.1 mechanosensitive ion channel [Luteimonas sp. MC1750]QQO06099.1 mechanosensitive ion channel [Luteimonas sp. MC1750]